MITLHIPQKLVAISLPVCVLLLSKMRHKTIDRSEYVSSAVKLTIVKTILSRSITCFQALDNLKWHYLAVTRTWRKSLIQYTISRTNVHLPESVEINLFLFRCYLKHDKSCCYQTWFWLTVGISKHPLSETSVTLLVDIQTF